MEIAASGAVPSAERTWSASNLLQSFSEAAAAVQPLPGNLGTIVNGLHTALVSPSRGEPLEPDEDDRQLTSMRPAKVAVSRFVEPRTPSLSRSPTSPANKSSSGTLSVLSAAAASFKDKTQQVAQQQKRALTVFQQKGGLVSWLHGEMEEVDGDCPAKPGNLSNSVNWSSTSAPTSPAALQRSGDLISFVENSDKDNSPTPPSPCSPIGSPSTKQEVLGGRRRSMPNMSSGSLFDNLFDKVTGVAISHTDQPPSGPTQTRVKLRPALPVATSSATSFEDFVNGQQRGNQARSNTKTLETGRQRAATMPLADNADILINDSASSPVLLKVRSDVTPISPRPSPEPRISLDDILSDEWSSTVLWTYLYGSAGNRDHQHQQRLSFLLETTFRITPLYRKVAGISDDTSAESGLDFKKLMARLKRLHSRFLVHNGSTAFAASGVPVASPAAIHAKNQLAVAVYTLSDQKVSKSEVPDHARLEKAVSALFQLAREVEREFRVLVTRSYASFGDNSLYHDFISNESARGNIVMLLRAAHIPFYQQPNSIANPVSLDELTLEENSAAATVFSKAGCQVFWVAILPDGSIEFTDVSPNTMEGSISVQTILQRTIEPFLNPSANIHPATSKPLAFNFTAGSADKLVYGAVMWLPVGRSDTSAIEEMPTGVCIVSRFSLHESMRHFLSCLWRRVRDRIKHRDADAIAITIDDTEYASLSMGRYFLARHEELLLGQSESDLLPAVDFKLSDLFDCLSLTNVLRLFAFVLLEKKIVLVGSRYTILFSAGEALRTLLYPLVWSHVYVPVLPLALKEFLQCPTPFIFGLHDSYVRRSDMPRPSSDLVIVNLDRDSLTGGGDVFLPPVRHSMMREELFRLCKPHLTTRDTVSHFDAGTSPSIFPVSAIRGLFRKNTREILASLEPCVNRFQLNEEHVTVVDNANSNQWPADTARFCSALLHTQAVSTYLASPRSDETAKPERVFV
ncbi:unnamed protein product [Phytophthora fragariaefolia]|uniref:Unnamed protein product n=1 Tax=Phytophthora fragariaefolia TaxID=1490495 RepID=A0A9W6WVT5_9STRA|nr:unnamed protein product [Phytophthora fragariaefolia]